MCWTYLWLSVADEAVNNLNTRQVLQVIWTALTYWLSLLRNTLSRYVHFTLYLSVCVTESSQYNSESFFAASIVRPGIISWRNSSRCRRFCNCRYCMEMLSSSSPAKCAVQCYGSLNFAVYWSVFNTRWMQAFKNVCSKNITQVKQYSRIIFPSINTQVMYFIC